MPKYKFEIQSCIDVVVEADNAEAARLQIVDNIHDHEEEMVKDCYVSDGEEVI